MILGALFSIFNAPIILPHTTMNNTIMTLSESELQILENALQNYYDKMQEAETKLTAGAILTALRKERENVNKLLVRVRSAPIY